MWGINYGGIFSSNISTLEFYLLIDTNMDVSSKGSPATSLRATDIFVSRNNSLIFFTNATIYVSLVEITVSVYNFYLHRTGQYSPVITYPVLILKHVGLVVCL